VADIFLHPPALVGLVRARKREGAEGRAAMEIGKGGQPPEQRRAEQGWAGIISSVKKKDEQSRATHEESRTAPWTWLDRSFVSFSLASGGGCRHLHRGSAGVISAAAERDESPVGVRHLLRWGRMENERMGRDPCTCTGADKTCTDAGQSLATCHAVRLPHTRGLIFFYYSNQTQDERKGSKVEKSIRYPANT